MIDKNTQIVQKRHSSVQASASKIIFKLVGKAHSSGSFLVKKYTNEGKTW
jgi:hypothetical protein